jgi:hypothetical protein
MISGRGGLFGVFRYRTRVYMRTVARVRQFPAADRVITWQPEPEQRQAGGTKIDKMFVICEHLAGGRHDHSQL